MKSVIMSAVAMCGVLSTSSAFAENEVVLAHQFKNCQFAWSYDGHSSLGGKWYVHGTNMATEAVRDKLAAMANLKELEHFIKTTSGKAIDLDHEKSKEKTKVKVAGSMNDSNEESLKFVNAHNYIIDISDVAIVPGSGYSKTTNHWRNGRTYKASLRITYTLRVFNKG